uniref:WGS project CAEQ00000000 data, annotated contig 336 n=1 Tax=Trypanosoma congolense (strain IL3000) TaxID=1068625 RepID=F9WF08_TRYCI|nr:unnamed protein product [Trypanosoma congolense IL3000]
MWFATFRKVLGQRLCDVRMTSLLNLLVQQPSPPMEASSCTVAVCVPKGKRRAAPYFQAVGSKVILLHRRNGMNRNTNVLIRKRYGYLTCPMPEDSATTCMRPTLSHACLPSVMSTHLLLRRAWVCSPSPANSVYSVRGSAEPTTPGVFLIPM